jgi:glucose-6-phosphate 1-dehydrogenase
VWESFVGGFRYVAGEYDHPDTFDKLKQVLDELDKERGTAENRLYYLATPPSTFPTVVQALATHGLTKPTSDDAFVRIVIEKPYGHDLQSALELDKVVHEAFDESQVYRIDHYLGKETVQNVLALRFANAIFEPIWNRRYVDHIEVTVSESLGVGHRGSFYEQAGALRDIVQNHVMQVLALTLMEPPVTFDADGIRDEKVKALRAVEVLPPEKVPSQVVRGQYTRGWVGGEEVEGYRDEEGVDPHSTTETYVAMKLKVDNWRWAGVPVYVRTGKRLPKRATEVAMQFHQVPHLPFNPAQLQDLEPDALVLRIQPDEGITLRFGAKVPGQAFRVRSVSMDFFYGAAFLEETPEAYERLLLDALIGDATLFIRTDEVEQAWRIVDPMLEAFGNDACVLAKYEAGTWGPAEADALIEADGRKWRKP